MESPPRPAVRWGFPALVGAVSFLAFLPALWAGWVNWDDPVNFQNNPHYRGLGWAQIKWMFSNITGHYMPLTWITLGFDYALWGMNAGGYHLTSLLFHAVNSVLCFRFLLVLLRRSAVAAGASDAALRACAAAGALLWAVHPLRVESVAWITERRDLVAGLFTFLSLLAYLRAVPAGPGGRTDGRWLAGSAALFALSLLGKAIGMTLPLALLIMDAVPLGRLQRGADGRIPWLPVLLEKVPFILVMFAGVAMTAWGQMRAGAMHEAETHGLANLLVQPGWRLVFYLGKVFLPLGLSPLYPYHRMADPWAPKLVIASLAALGLTILAWRYRKQAPGLLACWLAFAFLLGPVLGPIQAGPHFAADRYTYLAALPFSVLAAAFLLTRLRKGPASGPATAAVLILAVLGALCIDQTRIWNDSVALWTRAIRVDQSSSLPYTNRGAAYSNQGDLEKAVADFEEAIRLIPNAPKPYSNRAQAFGFMKRYDEALRDADTAIRLGPDEPRSWIIRAGLYFDLGRPREAARDYSRALEIDDTAFDAWIGRARARGLLGDFKGAVEDATLAHLLHPYRPDPLINRALALDELGQLDRAEADYTAAIALSGKIPEAWAGRGMVRAQKGRWADAVGDFERALATAPAGWPNLADATRRLQEARAKAGGR